MDLSVATWWWVAAGLVVAAELASGTFYLLMIGLGLAAAAVAAHLGLGAPVQLLVAAAIGGGATAVWHWHQRGQRSQTKPVAHNRDAHLDIGERVRVVTWASDRTARVNYRGSVWSARLQPGGAPVSGDHVVVAVEGNSLVLAPSSP